MVEYDAGDTTQLREALKRLRGGESRGRKHRKGEKEIRQKEDGEREQVIK